MASTELRKFTADEWVRSIVWHETGVLITLEAAGWILWEKTGFPSFWMTDDIPREIEANVLEYLRGIVRCHRCGLRFDPSHLMDGLCQVCVQTVRRVLVDNGW